MTPSEEAYKKEILPLVLALKEKATSLGFSSLIAIQVGQQIRISGDEINARPAMKDAFTVLFREED
jgi:hypothetical protein